MEIFHLFWLLFFLSFVFCLDRWNPGWDRKLSKWQFWILHQTWSIVLGRVKQFNLPFQTNTGYWFTDWNNCTVFDLVLFSFISVVALHGFRHLYHWACNTLTKFCKFRNIFKNFTSFPWFYSAKKEQRNFYVKYCTVQTLSKKVFS